MDEQFLNTFPISLLFGYFTYKLIDNYFYFKYCNLNKCLDDLYYDINGTMYKVKNNKKYPLECSRNLLNFNQYGDNDSSDDESSDDKPYNIDRIKMLLGNQKKEDHKFNLYDLLDNYIQPEYLDGENKWNSPYAKKLVDAEKLNLIWETPKILIFLIKRFEYSYTGAKKLNNIINFPIDNLDISKYLHPNHVSKYTNYSLFAINNHTNFNNFGFNGISFGHYYSYCKNYTDNKWYKYDDENVTQINESNIITNSAYMLFYKAIQ